MKWRGETYFIIGIIVVMLIIIVSSLTMPAIESKLFPLIFGSVVLVLAAIALGKELLVPKPKAKSGDMLILFRYEGGEPGGV